MMVDISKQEIYTQLWEMGSVTDWLLDEMQQEIIQAIRKTKSRIFCAVVTRRGGKTFCALTYAVEYCLNNPNSIVAFVAPQQNQARDIAKITMREILENCPDNLKPAFKTQENLFLFQNGSSIKLCGNNKQKIENIRGLKANVIICDEVGFWDDLKYSVNSVLLPMMNGIEGSKLIMISTPPKSAGHPFAKFVQDAQLNKAFIEKTVYDCPRFTSEDIDMFAHEQGGYESVSFQREYNCKFMTDTSMAVIPEASDTLMSLITQEVERPAFFDTYVSMDLGMKDLTAIIFAYYDYLNHRIVIEDEICLNEPSDLRIDVLNRHIQNKEEQLWGDPNDHTFYEPYKRVSDVDSFVLNDLYLQYNMYFIATEKRDKEATLNMTRTMLSNQQIVIHPRCEHLINHIKNATWKNSNKKDYDRSPDMGHYDFIDALIYLVRNIDYQKNPYPDGYVFDFKGTNTNSSSFLGKKAPKNTSNFREGIVNVFNPKRRF